MPDLVYKPTTPEEARYLVVGEVGYTFLSNTPQHVPSEHVAAVTAALTTTGVVTSGPAEV